MADPVAAVSAEDAVQNETILHKLDRSEKYWVWKAGLRAIICVLDIIALGCAAWVLATPTVLDGNPYLYYFEWNDSALGAIIVLGLSFIWCLVAIIVPLCLKPPRSLHPGIAVGIDLLFWLGFIVIGLFSLAGVISIQEFGQNFDGLTDPNWNNYNNNYTGSYYLAPNNTWVYNITYTKPDYSVCNIDFNSPDGCDHPPIDPSTIVRDCTPDFATCADQDAYINKLWHEKPKRFAIELLINVIEWLGVLAHFALFVWACVDTHRYNRSKTTGREKVIADRVIADLEKRGLVSVREGMVMPAVPPMQPPRPQQSSAQPVTSLHENHADADEITRESYGVAS